ncbi:hypothetical protein N2152v2_008388 [Parachlorella kessleri]
MFPYYALAGVREGGASRRPKHRGAAGSRRREGLWFWRWFSPLLAISVVAWLGYFHHFAALSRLPSKLPDAFLQQQQSSNGVCEVRLSRVLPALGSGSTDARVAQGSKDGGGEHGPDGVANTHERRRLYENMAASLASKGLLVGGTQGLSLGDLFQVHGRGLKAVLHELDIPVRAVVMPLLDTKVSAWLHDALERHLVPIMPEAGMWVQNHGLYHSTVFHASTHTSPIPATLERVEDEKERIASVARQSCPLRVVLERVVATPGGTVLACWQLANGTDPARLRRELRAALPEAPAKQMVTDEAILHTTLARVVAQPRLAEDRDDQPADAVPGSAGAAALQRAVHEMTQELCGVEATMDTLWFVEEQDRLALALEGRFSKHPLPLQCEGGQQAQRAVARHPARQLREEQQPQGKIFGEAGAGGGEGRLVGDEGKGADEREKSRRQEDAGSVLPLRRMVHKQPRQQDKRL